MLLNTKYPNENSQELTVLQKEYEWLLRTQTTTVFQQVDEVLRDSCRRLPLPSKQGTFGTSVPNLGLQPEKFTLQSRSNDAVRCVLTLMGDNIVQAEVAIRYPKAPGHVFRSVAQPHVQWKLQQIQDLANYIQNALQAVNSAQSNISVLLQPTNHRGGSAHVRNQQLPGDQLYELGAEMLRVTDNVLGLVKSARSCLSMPKKRSLAELMQYPPNKCFSPALPPDLPLSFYVAGNRLQCAAYHLQPSAHAHGKQTFVVYQGECQVQWLTEVLAQLALALQLIQQLHDKLQVFTTNTPYLQ